MIAYLPTIYPDELVYSWFCRYYVHSGFLTHKMALQELYCNRSDNPSKEFMFLINYVGLETLDSFRNNTAYIQNWLQVLRNDKRFIVSAATKAEKAVNLILGTAV